MSYWKHANFREILAIQSSSHNSAAACRSGEVPGKGALPRNVKKPRRTGSGVEDLSYLAVQPFIKHLSAMKKIGDPMCRMKHVSNHQPIMIYIYMYIYNDIGACAHIGP